MFRTMMVLCPIFLYQFGCAVPSNGSPEFEGQASRMEVPAATPGAEATPGNTWFDGIAKQKSPTIVPAVQPTVNPHWADDAAAFDLPKNNDVSQCNAITAVYDGSLFIKTAEDVEMLNQYAEVTGNVMLALNDNVSDVTVDCLRTIGGHLFKNPCAATSIKSELTTIAFPRLTSVGTDLRVWTTKNLTTASFPALSTVAGTVSFHDNIALTHLDLSALSTVGGDVELRDSPVDFVELMELSEVGGSVRLRNMDQATGISFPSLVQAKGLSVWNMGELASFSLPTLQALETLYLRDNPALTSFDLPHITELPKMLKAIGNHAMVSLSMPQLVRVGHLEATANTALTSVEFEALEAIENSMSFKNNSEDGVQPLASVSMPALETVGKSIYVIEQLSLNELYFPQLKEVGNDLRVVKTATLPGFVMANLTDVGGNLVVAENQDLSRFSLPALIAIGGDLRLQDSATLGNFVLSELTTVGENIQVQNNESLAALNLPELTQVGEDIVVTDNIVLPQCVVHSLVDQLIDAGQPAGEVAVEGNDDSCECSEQGEVVEGSCS